jgi:hypothetical protein
VCCACHLGTAAVSFFAWQVLATLTPLVLTSAAVQGSGLSIRPLANRQALQQEAAAELPSREAHAAALAKQLQDFGAEVGHSVPSSP